MSSRAREYLRPPLDGYSGALAPEWAAEIRRGYDALVASGGFEVAKAAGQALVNRFGELLPATVLMAQSEFASGDPFAAFERLEPALRGQPTYLAGHLLLGRSAELSGRPAAAFRAYRQVAGDPLAARRLAAVADAAVQEVRSQLDDELERGRVAEAQALSAELADWAPGSLVTLEGSWKVARASGDPVAELLAVRPLAATAPDRRDWTERRAELEVAVGDPKAGVDLYEELSRRDPNDPRLADGLAGAKFRWRLELLPEAVSGLVGPRRLTRGDFATLLYWLVPGVRTDRGRGGRIVADVPLEHPQREEIVRVVNTGLLEVADSTLHRFAPDRAILRSDALRSVGRWLAGQAACAAPLAEGLRPSTDAICEVATRCRLLDEVAECLPGAALSGVEASQILRRALDLGVAPSRP